MLDALKKFFERPEAAPDATDATQVAACALMLEMAYADGTFTDDERAHVERALAGAFDLSPERVRALIAHAEAERRDAIDLHQFTSTIVRNYDEGQRYVLAELLWRVVLADGELSRPEDELLYRLGKLLDLRPGYLANIRKQGGV